MFTKVCKSKSDIALTRRVNTDDLVQVMCPDGWSLSCYCPL